MKIALIGTGNVAWSLARAIDRLGDYTLSAVYGRDITKAREVIGNLSGHDAIAVDSIRAIPRDTDIYVIAVKDSAIEAVADSVPPDRSGALWLHTAGGVGVSVLARVSSMHGVLYPLQTFTRGIDVDFKDVPLFIEGSTPEAICRIEHLANALSTVVAHADSLRRRKMHVAAVFGCNFANFMWTMAQELMEQNGMTFEMLRPLIDETLRKAYAISPMEGQTGPARRHDCRLVNSHLSLLDGDKAELYKMLSKSIMNYYDECH